MKKDVQGHADGEYFREGSRNGTSKHSETAGCCGLRVHWIDDVPVKKAQSIPEGNAELGVEPPTPQSKLRRSTRTTRAPKRYSPFLHYLLLTEQDVWWIISFLKQKVDTSFFTYSKSLSVRSIQMKV